MGKKRNLTPHPFEGEDAVLSGARDGLSEKHRKIIEGAYAFREKTIRSEMEGRAPRPSFHRQDYDWTTRAACRDHPDPEVFFPSGLDAHPSMGWRQYCDGCPVRLECRTFGMENEGYGIWGGAFLVKGKPRALQKLGRPFADHPQQVLIPLPDDLSEAASDAVVTS